MTEPHPPLDEQISAVLAACDEALAVGTTPRLNYGDDVPPEVRERLERGLRSLGLLRRMIPAVEVAPTPLPSPTDAALPTDPPFSRLGRFIIRRELGRGACG